MKKYRKRNTYFDSNNSDPNEKYNSNIDTFHNKKIKQYEIYEKNEIPKLENKIKKIEKEIEKNNGNNMKLLELNEELKKIRSKIDNFHKEKEKYFLKNCKFIFNFFEDKQSINENKNNKKNVENFFFSNKEVKDNITEDIKQNESNIAKNIINNHTRYFKNNDFNMINFEDFIYDKDVCSSCNKGELIQVNHEGILVCNICFKNYKYLVDNDKPSYKEPPKEISFYAYKRINHFREIIAQFQAKETTDIPDEIIEKIKNQIKKERLDLKDITNKKTKEILKKLNLNKYYEHIPFIKDKLGIKPPIMTPQLETTLCNLFMEIQEPYSKYCPKDRVNFLNYYYTIYKLCELLDQRQFLPYFPMLIDREKKIEQDMIWKNICADLDWDYIPTV
tara:strand:- start:3214 stop:4383 length:1170 start_codon:yes stop_codon:yes gene_type:complete